MIKVAIIGTQGLPAKYGGFETLVENMVLKKDSTDVKYTVFCSAKDYSEKLETFNGADLVYIPLFHANGAHSVPYDILSMIKAVRGFDVIVILGTSGCVFLPIFKLFCRKKVIVNIDGLEHRRAKWGKLARLFLKTSEAVAVRFADTLVVDNPSIQDYVRATYDKPSVFIAYGADHVLREVDDDKKRAVLAKYNLTEGQYAFAVCRIEPENNCHIILEACAESGERVVFIGNWDKNKYGCDLKRKYSKYDNISIVNAIYDLDTLYVLRSNCKIYLHGHSAGGTNPSLVEAMMIGAPVFAFDCCYNRKTTYEKACYFQDKTSLVSLINVGDELLGNGRAMSLLAQERYMWSLIVKQYEDLY